MAEHEPEFVTWTCNEVLHDHENGVVVLHHEYGIQRALDAVKYMHNTGQFGPPDLRRLMKVPGTLIETWCQQQGVDFAEFGRSQELKNRFVNDSANSVLAHLEGAAYEHHQLRRVAIEHCRVVEANQPHRPGARLYNACRGTAKP